MLFPDHPWGTKFLQSRILNRETNMDPQDVLPRLVRCISVTCLGYTVPESDILAAINRGTGWATTTPPTRMGKIPFPSLPFQSNPNPFHCCWGHLVRIRFDS